MFRRKLLDYQLDIKKISTTIEVKTKVRSQKCATQSLAPFVVASPAVATATPRPLVASPGGPAAWPMHSRQCGYHPAADLKVLRSCKLDRGKSARLSCETPRYYYETKAEMRTDGKQSPYGIHERAARLPTLLTVLVSNRVDLSESGFLAPSRPDFRKLCFLL